MRLTTSASIAAISLLVAALSAHAARRPHYGGTLRIDTSSVNVSEMLARLNWQPAKPMRAPDAAASGAGPFRIAGEEPGKSVSLEANDDYWAGRPYLDRVEIRLGRGAREQALDFELGRADIIDVPLADVRRAQQQGARVVETQPIRTLGLVLENDRVREALALAIDRSAIRNVLLQRQGEISGALLPQWLTGYAFLFPSDHNVSRARELAAGVPALAFAFDAQSPLLRPIAERIMLNAAEAGLTLRPAGADKPDVRLVSLRIASPDPKQALGDMAAALGGSLPPAITDDPNSLYQAERALIAARHVIPLFHLPVAYQLSPAVRGWNIDPCDRWDL
ncbi:MAG TPA: ABC transporter substrate-binding protein, partial [Bryobacteraceae bacterium]|nr:ABC transporter substrate-binding protein [Bryobacteraceae bacterium]